MTPPGRPAGGVLTVRGEAVAAGTAAVRRMLARTSARAVVPYLAMGLLLVITIVIAGREIDHHVTAIESWIMRCRPWSVLAFVGLFVLLTSLLLPDTVLSIIAGTLFGLRWGLVVVVSGALLAATLQFALSRHLLRARIQRAIATRLSLAATQRAVNAHELRLEVLLRLTPLNPAVISYLLGAAGVRLGGFLLAFLASVPGLMLEVYFGYASKHVARMAGRSMPAVYLHDLTVIGVLVVGIVLMVLISRVARTAVLDAVGQTNSG
jgi:uncharacterized membrane protein YdjX (TVP38/TMEM64 family)